MIKLCNLYRKWIFGFNVVSIVLDFTTPCSDNGEIVLELVVSLLDDATRFDCRSEQLSIVTVAITGKPLNDQDLSSIKQPLRTDIRSVHSLSNLFDVNTCCNYGITLVIITVVSSCPDSGYK